MIIWGTMLWVGWSQPETQPTSNENSKMAKERITQPQTCLSMRIRLRPAMKNFAFLHQRPAQRYQPPNTDWQMTRHFPDGSFIFSSISELQVCQERIKYDSFEQSANVVYILSQMYSWSEFPNSKFSRPLPGYTWCWTRSERESGQPQLAYCYPWSCCMLDWHLATLTWPAAWLSFNRYVCTWDLVAILCMSKPQPSILIFYGLVLTQLNKTWNPILSNARHKYRFSCTDAKNKKKKEIFTDRQSIFEPWRAWSSLT